MQALLTILAVLLEKLVAVAPSLLAYFAGRRSRKQEVAETARLVREQQLEALQEAPRSRDAILDRLKEGKM